MGGDHSDRQQRPRRCHRRSAGPGSHHHRPGHQQPDSLLPVPGPTSAGPLRGGVTIAAPRTPTTEAAGCTGWTRTVTSSTSSPFRTAAGRTSVRSRERAQVVPRVRMFDQEENSAHGPRGARRRTSSSWRQNGLRTGLSSVPTEVRGQAGEPLLGRPREFHDAAGPPHQLLVVAQVQQAFVHRPAKLGILIIGDPDPL